MLSACSEKPSTQTRNKIAMIYTYWPVGEKTSYDAMGITKKLFASKKQIWAEIEK